MDNKLPNPLLKEKFDALASAIQKTKLINKRINFSLEVFLKNYKPKSRRKSRDDF